MLKSIFTAAGKLHMPRAAALMGALSLGLAGFTTPADAQELETFDPDVAFETSAPSEVPAPRTSEVATQIADVGAIDADLADPNFRTAPPLESPIGTNTPAISQPAQPGFSDEFSNFENSPTAEQAHGWDDASQTAAGEPVPQWSDPTDGETVANAAEQSGTYGEDDLIGAAEGLFGKGAQGLAGLIEDLLRKQGEPNGYIVGREAGGAFVVGARYGSGTLHHKIEGERKVYWTGPSIGFDAGANAGNTFVLVYNLFDSEDIFKRYPAGEGQAYLVGGLHASYMRRGDVVLIPIRMGAGLRLGVNAGYMRFSKKHRWLPF
ncbi:MAG: DUF1134 domain-containing protein [Pseudomonadota bacterium]